MNRTLPDARRWVDQGTKLVADALVGPARRTSLRPPTPGWSRKHVLAHLAANAEAVGNLVHWAATGERTPMYSPSSATPTSSPAAGWPGRIVAWFERSASALATAMDSLSSDAWQAEVVTAQGRTVPASEAVDARVR